MTIEWWRDLSVIIFGFTATAVLLFLAVLAYLIYMRVVKVLDPMRRTVEIVEQLADMIQQQVAAIVPYIILVSKGVEAVRGLFRKEEKK